MSDTSENLPVVYQEDWPALATARIISPLGHPVICAVLEAIAEGVQDLEDDAFDVITSTTIDLATGHNLERIGAIVGEKRGPLSDEEYRPFIRAKMLINSSNGTIDDLINIWKALTAPYVTVEYFSSTAEFTLQVVRSEFMSDQRMRRVARAMETARPAARGMILIEAVNGSFGFQGTEFAEPFGVGLFARNVISG